MLNAPPGRYPVLYDAGRPDPHGTWPFRHHIIEAVRRMPAAVGKIAVAC